VSVGRFQEEEERLGNVLMPDKHLVTLWLATTHWHEYITGMGHPTEFLCGLVVIPKNNDQTLPGLHSMVNGYYQDTLDLLPITDELVLKRLNSPHPLHEYVSFTI
jgi:hypothetical protein